MSSAITRFLRNACPDWRVGRDPWIHYAALTVVVGEGEEDAQRLIAAPAPSR